MISDSERREVARKIREIDVDSFSCYAQEYEAFCNAIGLYDGVEYSEQDWPERLTDLIEPQPITGDTSDGYHTFNELYDHRAKLFSVVVRDHREIAWKSKLHHDGTMYEGMFIVGVETPQGQATYHYDIDPYWDLFDCKELDRAPEWDGHTPHQAIDRIAALEPSCDRDALLALADEMDRHADMAAGHVAYAARFDFAGWARRIREALGVER